MLVIHFGVKGKIVLKRVAFLIKETALASLEQRSKLEH